MPKCHLGHQLLTVTRMDNFLLFDVFIYTRAFSHGCLPVRNSWLRHMVLPLFFSERAQKSWERLQGLIPDGNTSMPRRERHDRSVITAKLHVFWHMAVQTVKA